MQKIWLDTDIGNDIDDTVALAYLLKHPQCDLLGISTVSGQPIERAKLADVLCRAAHREVPIYPGIEEPLLTPQRQPIAHQTRYLAHWEHSKEFQTDCAVAQMYRAIAQNPGEVTLLAVGPMTNVALLLRLYPDAARLLKDIVVMCGEFFGKSRYLRCDNEWNSFCDPYASAMLYATQGVAVRSVGLDVTSRIMMDAVQVKESYTSPLMKVVYAFSGFEDKSRDIITYHDPLAAVSMFEPHVMQYVSGQVSVELQSARLIGRTYFDEKEDGKHEVGSTVDEEAFYRAYFDIVNA